MWMCFLLESEISLLCISTVMVIISTVMVIIFTVMVIISTVMVIISTVMVIISTVVVIEISIGPSLQLGVCRYQNQSNYTMI
jgi:hypothetical protein